MNRSLVIQIHLGLAAFFLPYLLLMPLSGGLHLLGVKEAQTKTEAFRVEGSVPADTNVHETFFRDIFKSQNIDFDFEMIRGNGTDFTFRPSSRVHYVATKDESGITFFKVEPSILKRLIELHQGHGPAAMKYLEIAFAFALILVTLSGLYLAFTVPRFRKISGLFFVTGLLVIAFALFV